MQRCLTYILMVAALLCGLRMSATHNRAGEIIYKRIEPFSKKVGGQTVPVFHYSITVIRYTDHGSDVADRCEDTVYFGDGERGIAPRVNSNFSSCTCGYLGSLKLGCGELITNDPNYKVKYNVYTITHFYAGPGNYLIRSFDPNRNNGVQNIPNSVNVPFYLESLLIINTFSGANSSPVFTFKPIDKACMGQCFEHNPGAFDPDPTDSLSFELTTSRGNNGETVPGYSFPEGAYSINAVTGELRWCSPPKLGEYNLAFIVKEWRKNTNGEYQLTGYVLRDMQVIVEACDTKRPPQGQPPPDTCIEAGSLLLADILITDPDGSRVTVTGGGGPFEGVTPLATLSNTEASTAGGGFTTHFRWQTTCEHLRKQPYSATLKLQDNDSPVRQVSFSTFNIRVVPPSIKNITAVPAGSTIRLNWSTPICLPAVNALSHYLVYRKNNCDSVTFSPCDFSPLTAGYTLIRQVGKDSTFFVDDNNGDGLVVGQNYNYIVTGVYMDGSETYASSGVCAELKRDVPVLLNVDVDATSTTSGIIFVRWARPLKTTGNLDTVALPGPYTFRLAHRAPGSNAFTAVFTSTAQYLYQLDTFFFHKDLNTVLGPHEYQVEFSAADVQVGSSQRATSVYLQLTPDDRKVQIKWTSKTPWENTVFRIHRKDPGSTSYSVVGSTSQQSYIDSLNVQNGFTYCYRLESEGGYSDPAIYKPLINFSQDSCVSPKDLTPPCTPTIELTADCPAGYVGLSWTDVVKVCGQSGDVRNYILYYKRTVNDEFVKVAEGNLTSYEFTGLTFVSGCYAVQALDTNGNSSSLSQAFCIDNCPIFELPNVFTPNGDGSNDHFKAIRVRQIDEIDLFVIDRWGNRIYTTKDPYFQWNGFSNVTNTACNEGTYYYVCDVYEPRLKGIVKRTLKGTVYLAR